MLFLAQAAVCFPRTEACRRTTMIPSRFIPKSLFIFSLFQLSLLPHQQASAQQLPTAPGASVSSLTPEPGYFTEPGIAINPNNPEQVVAVFQDNAHAAYSTDSGKQWQLATGVESMRYKVSGDVSRSEE